MSTGGRLHSGRYSGKCLWRKLPRVPDERREAPGDPPMKAQLLRLDISRRVLPSAMAVLPTVYALLDATSTPAQTPAPGGQLPSWNDGPAKQAILDFVRATTDRSNLTMSSRRSALRCSTRTAHYGQNTRCIRRWSTVSSGSRRWSPRSQRSRPSSRSRRCSAAIERRWPSCRCGILRRFLPQR
jgi:hypothetical protein